MPSKKDRTLLRDERKMEKLKAKLHRRMATVRMSREEV